MMGSGEEVGGFGFDELIPLLPQQLHVPCQGGRVAGDVHQALGGHLDDGLDHLRRDALPGRVHADHVRADAPLGQGQGGLAGVGAEELRVVHPVPGGVGPGVLHCGGDHLRPDGPLCLPGHAQGDGADAAVQIQHRLLPGEPRKVQGPAVENLRLVPVHLVKRRHLQPEGQAAEGVLQIVPPPEGVAGLAQNHVGLVRVHRQHHPHQARLGGPEGLDQRVLVGQGFPVGDHRAEGFPRPVHPDVKVADEALVGLLVVSRNVIGLHPPLEGRPQTGGGQGLEQAVRRVDHVVASRPEEAHPGAVSHGELDLVPVPVRLLGGVDHLHGPLPAADALEGVLDPAAFQLGFLLVGHVPQLAAAALGVLGAVGNLTMGGGLHHLCHPAPGGGLAHLQQLNPAQLPGQGPFHKDRLAVQPGHALAGAAVALHAQGVYLVFLGCHGDCSLLVGIFTGRREQAPPCLVHYTTRAHS